MTTLREAINAGRARGIKHISNTYLRLGVFDNADMACPIGLAYFGCHPNAEPRRTSVIQITRWANDHLSLPVRPSTSMRVVMNLIDLIVEVNDVEIGYDGGIEDVMARLTEHTTSDGTPVLDVEVCDAT